MALQGHQGKEEIILIYFDFFLSFERNIKKKKWSGENQTHALAVGQFMEVLVDKANAEKRPSIQV